MQRFRTLSKSGNRFVLRSSFHPSSDSELFEFEDSSVLVIFDFSLRKPISVSRCGLIPLPPLYYIAEEIDYMFNLFKSLSPYETQTSQSQDIPQV